MDAIETAFTATLGAGTSTHILPEQHGKPGRRIDGKETTRSYEKQPADANEQPEIYLRSGRLAYPRLSRPPLWNLRMKRVGYRLPYESCSIKYRQT